MAATKAKMRSAPGLGSDVESQDEGAIELLRSDRVASVIVPIVVAVLAMVGTLGAVAIQRIGTIGPGDPGVSAQSGTENTGVKVRGPAIDDFPRAKVDVTSFSSEPSAPLPAIELHFSGTIDGLAHRDQLVMLAKFGAVDWDAFSNLGKLTAFGRRLYAVSPPAMIYPDGTWEIVWVLTRFPSTATFIPAVILIGASDEMTPPCGFGACSSTPGMSRPRP